MASEKNKTEKKEAPAKREVKEINEINEAGGEKVPENGMVSELKQQITKRFGMGSVFTGTDGEFIESAGTDVISTGIISLDAALGIGGLPKGRIVEIYGPESSGKTTLTLNMIAKCQAAGGIAAFIDAEHALDVNFAKKIGVDLSNLLISQPGSGEECFDICTTLVKSGAVSLVVIDSVAAMVPRAEIEGLMGDAHVGLQARLMSQALRKLTGVISKTNCVAIFINQLRDKVGVLYGSPEVTPGGRALKFYSSVRLDVRRQEQLKNGTEVVGNHTKVKVVKNKVAPPFREAEFDILYGKGISREGEILDLAVKLDIVEKSGAWFSYNGQRIGQGRDNVRQYLCDNPELANELDKKLRENMDKIDELSRPGGKKSKVLSVEPVSVDVENDEDE